MPVFLTHAFALSGASDVYIAQGASGDCSQATPCGTFADALAAVASNGTVHVAAGTYTEAVDITQSVKIVGAGEGSTIIDAPSSLPTAASGGSVVTIDGAAVSTDVSGLTVSGPGPSGCGSIMAGVFVEGNATADLHDMAVANIADNPISGCQNGVGIFVGRNSLSQVGTATIDNVSVTGYQKGGIVVDNTGSSATIENSTITGAGAVGFIAQNGIQVSRGATATITGNAVNGNSYTGSDFAAGILLYGAAGSTSISGNTVSGNQLGFWTDTPGPVQNLSLSGFSGNTRDAVADVNDATDAYSSGQWPTPTTTYADASISGTTDGNGSDIVTTQGGSHAWGYDAFNTIQNALNAVATNGTVNVANGSYSEGLNITKSGINLVGQSQAGVQVTANHASPYGQGVSVDGQDNVSISNMTFNDPAGSPISYAFQAYQDSGLNLSNLTFNGPGKATTPKIGGVDVNSSQNVTYDNVSASNYSKNGFSFTAQYKSTDNPTSGVSLSNITADNNNWAGLVFYTMNSSSIVGHDISGVTFGGTNSLTNNNAQGLFVEGDSDANLGSFATPRWKVTDGSGNPVDLGTTNFSGNTTDILNYQTEGLSALTATFGGLTGDQMTSSQRGTEDGLIIDQNDDASLGLVKYYDLPFLLSPANGSYLTNAGTLDWSDVPGVVGYQYESATSGATNVDGSLTSPIYHNNSLTASQIDASGTGEGTYYWQVRADFGGGVYGPWTAPWSLTVDKTAPTVPTGGLPNNSIKTTNDFYFTWNASTDASPVTYQFQSSQNPASSGGVLTTGLWTSGTLTSPTIHSTGAPDGPWYWQVRAVDAAGNTSAWSSIWKVTIDTATLGAPTLNSPSNGAVVNGASITNSWSSVTNAVKYEYESFNDAAGTSLRFDGTYTTTSKTATNVADGTVFYWRVRAIDQYGLTGPWSNGGGLWKITVDSTAPVVHITAPASGSHVNGTVNITGTITDANPDHYYLVIKDSHGNVVGGPGTVYSTTLTPSYNWDSTSVADGTYTIDLEARDAAGNKDANSTATETITVDNTGPTGLSNSSPADGTFKTTAGLTSIDWSDATDPSGPVSYYYESSNSPATKGDGSFTSPVYQSGALSTSQISTAGTPEGVYYWHVKAVDALGNASAWTSPWQVTVDNTAPDTPTASPGAGTNYTTAQDVQLSSNDALSGPTTIYYTTNGSTPSSTNGTEYQSISPVHISVDTTLKAVAYDQAGNESAVLAAFYGIAPVLSSETVTTVTTNSITVTWTTNQVATSRIVYDTVSHSLGSAPNYGYAFSTAETDTSPEVTSHSVTITGLNAGTQYFFRTISHGSPESVSDELTATTTAAPVTLSTVFSPSTFSSFATTTNPQGGGAGGGGAGGTGGVGGAGGTVLGASTTTPSTTSGNGQVKGTNTNTPSSFGTTIKPSSKKFLGLGWWWLLVLAILAFLAFLWRRRSGNEN